MSAVLIIRCGFHEHALAEEIMQEYADNPESDPMPECLLRAIVSDWLYNARRLREEEARP